MPSDKDHIESTRFRGVKPATEGKYRQVIELYGTTVESLKSQARRFGVNDCTQVLFTLKTARAIAIMQVTLLKSNIIFFISVTSV